jgi:hypothetical protein
MIRPKQGILGAYDPTKQSIPLYSVLTFKIGYARLPDFSNKDSLSIGTARTNKQVRTGSVNS